METVLGTSVRVDMVLVVQGRGSQSLVHWVLHHGRVVGGPGRVGVSCSGWQVIM